MKCKDCLFWSAPDPKMVEEAERQNMTAGGDCHRYPPVFVEICSKPGVIPLTNSPLIMHDIKVAFPEVREDWWCGEWFDKNEEWPPTCDCHDDD